MLPALEASASQNSALRSLALIVAAELASNRKVCASPSKCKVAALLASALISRISTGTFTVAALDTSKLIRSHSSVSIAVILEALLAFIDSRGWA